MKQDMIVRTECYRQNSQEFLSAILPYEFVENHSEVLVYGKNPKGYQREPVPSHYNKIRDYILNTKNFIFPTSIVLAIDENDRDTLLEKKGTQFFINAKNIISKKKIFRIVDGQHRILALKEAIRSKPELRLFELNVIIIVTKPNKRSVEMEIFYDINSKGKRLKVDLIELARFNYRILENSLKEKEINEHISIQTAYYLNEKMPKSIWHNAIKFGIHDEHVIGIIGVNAFRESISTIVDCFLKQDDNAHYKNLNGATLINYTEKAAKVISEFLHHAWDTTIKNKWQYCFADESIELDLYLEPQKYYYHSKYYLQRTMGAKAINSILSSVVTEKTGNNVMGLTPKALKAFDSIIKKSYITSDDWTVGGTFAGYSSESGFKKVSQIVLNELPMARSFNLKS